MCVFPSFTLIVILRFAADQTFSDDSLEMIVLFFGECRHQVYCLLFTIRSSDSWGGHPLFYLPFIIHLIFVLLSNFTPKFGVYLLLEDLDGDFFGNAKMVFSLASNDPIFVVAAFLNLTKVEIIKT